MLTRALLSAVVVAAICASVASAQVAPPHALQVTPYVGLGLVFENGAWVSGSLDALIQVDRASGPLNWTAHASIRELGVVCSESCDASGLGVGVGVTHSIGAIQAGGGMSLVRQFGAWRGEPYVQARGGHRRLAVQVRIEALRLGGATQLHIPMLVGVRLGSRR